MLKISIVKGQTSFSYLRRFIFSVTLLHLATSSFSIASFSASWRCKISVSFLFLEESIQSFQVIPLLEDPVCFVKSKSITFWISRSSNGVFRTIPTKSSKEFSGWIINSFSAFFLDFLESTSLIFIFLDFLGVTSALEEVWETLTTSGLVWSSTSASITSLASMISSGVWDLLGWIGASLGSLTSLGGCLTTSFEGCLKTSFSTGFSTFSTGFSTSFGCS